MKRILTAAQTREIDRIAIEELGLPGVLLMEHAGRAVADRASELVEGGRAWVVAGGGNNGGDGYAAARMLRARGAEVRLLAVVPPDRLRGDAAFQAETFSRFGGEVSLFRDDSLAEARQGDVVVDALLGTGITRAPAGTFGIAVEAMNRAREQGAKVLAVDLPSGVCADTGKVFGAAVSADATVTFGALKRGLVTSPGADCAGDVRVADISWPSAALDASEPVVWRLDEAWVRSRLPHRSRATHKGSFGHCFVVAGSEGKTGAAAMAGLGALTGGAGLCTVASRPGALPWILSHGMELMGAPLPGEGPLTSSDVEPIMAAAQGKDVLLVGPGIPRGDGTHALIREVLLRAPCPVVVDADGLNALAEDVSILRQAKAPVVLTPHPGEMSRLLGVSISEVQGDRIEAARGFAMRHGCTVVLKGAGTVVADPDGEAAVCPTGNPGMATGGTGDVLGGFLAALLAQGLPPSDASRVAVYVHGLAGDRMAGSRGMAGLLASDLLDGIGEVWASWKL